MTQHRLLSGAVCEHLGRIGFEEAVARNDDQLAAARLDAQTRLLFFEPSAPVLTLGRRAGTDEGRRALDRTLELCACRGIEVISADRGGLATLHAPGQLVVFVAIPPPAPPIRMLVVELLRAAQAVASEAGAITRLDCDRDVGLWRGRDKIASVGLRVRDRGVLHGMSFNVAVDERLASGLVLCGHRDRGFGSIASHVPVEQIELLVNQTANRLALRAAAGDRARARGHAGARGTA